MPLTSMKRTRAWFVVVLLAIVAMATVSWTSGATVRFVDQAGTPASEAYVQYHYDGSLINLVHPVSYIARGSVIVRTDAQGRARIPGRIHVRSPLPPSTPPRLFIDHVYVSRLHNAFGPIAERTTSRPGVFTVDERREQVTVADVSQDPGRWATSLAYLFDCIRETVSREGSRTPMATGDTYTAASARELIGHLRSELGAFHVRYGQTARARPPAPQGGSELDRHAWEAQTNAHLAREPLWGPYIDRIWRHNLTELKALEASIP